VLRLVVHYIVLNAYLLVSESGYRTMPVTLKFYGQLQKNVTKVEAIVQLSKMLGIYSKAKRRKRSV